MSRWEKSTAGIEWGIDSADRRMPDVWLYVGFTGGSYMWAAVIGGECKAKGEVDQIGDVKAAMLSAIAAWAASVAAGTLSAAGALSVEDFE